MPKSGKSSLFLQPRQSGGTNLTMSATANQSPFGGSFPVPYLAFGIAAIALFVLVVAFVLLRIFVRNRRLRRMGIYPEGPIDRLLGGNFREFEDNLPPPRLWEAKITDVGAGGLGSEKSGLGADMESSDSKRQGWDALMPVSAALPPNLYPLIYQANEKKNNSFEPPSTYPPPPSNQHAARLGRHMPQFLRRHTGDAAESAIAATNAPPSASTATDFASAVAGNNGDRTEDKLAASVNVTVLIAMPSSRTVFPSSRRLASSASTTTALNQRSSLMSTTDAKLQEVEEDSTVDQDALSLKGKARRAPSLRSVKSTTSLKSVAETRREAFFGQITKDEAGKDNPSNPVMASPAPAYEEEEEEELPELMFGTASVPIFTRLASASNRQESLAASRLLQPSKSDILALISAANQAREKKVEVETAATKTKKQDEGDHETNRASVAETSLDGGANTGLNDRSDDDALQSPMGDVAMRMFQSHNVDQTQGFEMTSMGPSRTYNSTTNTADTQTPNTPTPILSMASPFDASAKTPTSSMPLNGSSSRRLSGSSWHTGVGDADHRT